MADAPHLIELGGRGLIFPLAEESDTRGDEIRQPKVAVSNSASMPSQSQRSK